MARRSEQKSLRLRDSSAEFKDGEPAQPRDQPVVLAYNTRTKELSRIRQPGKKSVLSSFL